MKRIRTLQEQLKTGKITKDQYEAELKKLLDDEFIDQDEHDEAAAFDPEAEKPIFTQADVDRIVVVKATKLVRKALKDAGVDVDASNKDLLETVADLAKKGQGAGDGGTDGAATDQDLAKLKQLEGKLPKLESRVQDLAVENAVLKGLGGKLKAVNPVQVVRALKLDYMDLVEIDDESGEATTKSVETALKRIAQAEPNLFEATEGGEEGAGDDEGGTGFKGKGPGGGTAGGSTKDLEKKRAEAKTMLAKTGITFPETK
jgi:hypothetical protein